MKQIAFHYGKGRLTYAFEEEELAGILESSLNGYIPEAGEAELIERAMGNPVNSPGLRDLSRGKNKVVIIASNHTRPVPSKLIIPPILREIRAGNPDGISVIVTQ